MSRSAVPGRRKYEASTGVAVSDSSSEPVSAKMTVSAIGRNIFPSTPCSARIGRCTIVMIATPKTTGRRTSSVARRTTSRARCFGSAWARWRTQFSITITALSTIRPKSIAPRLIRLPAMPKASIRLPAKSIDSGIARATIRLARRFPRRISRTATTSTPPSARLCATVPIVFSMSTLRS